MCILLLGATGLAGQAFRHELMLRGIDVLCVARSNANIMGDLSNVDFLNTILKEQNFVGVINAAANVNILECENYPDTSQAINAKIVSVLGEFSHRNQVPLLQISTDHYYNYGGACAHKETDEIVLLNEYARQKYQAETFALQSDYALVLRTSIVGYKKAKRDTLIDWAIASLKQGNAINLYKNAYTSAVDIKLFARYACDMFLKSRASGLFNLASREVFSKEKLIRELAKKVNLPHDQCPSVEIDEFDTLRANCLGLDVSRAENLLGISLPSLADTVEEIKNDIGV